jgi:hypothetical protein
MLAPSRAAPATARTSSGAVIVVWWCGEVVRGDRRERPLPLRLADEEASELVGSEAQLRCAVEPRSAKLRQINALLALPGRERGDA